MVVQRETNGVFLVHVCVYTGIVMVSHLSFCMCSYNPPFPVVMEGGSLHLWCAFSGWRLLICVFHKSCCLAKVKGGFSLVFSVQTVAIRADGARALIMILKSCHMRKT